LAHHDHLAEKNVLLDFEKKKGQDVTSALFVSTPNQEGLIPYKSKFPSISSNPLGLG
jgi:hypothetical protein